MAVGTYPTAWQLYHREGVLVPIEQKAGWAPRTVLTSKEWRKRIDWVKASIETYYTQDVSDLKHQCCGGGVRNRFSLRHTSPDRTWYTRSLLYNGYWRSFPGVKRPALGAGHPPHLAQRWSMSRHVPVLSLRACMACYGENFPFRDSYWE